MFNLPSRSRAGLIFRRVGASGGVVGRELKPVERIHQGEPTPTYTSSRKTLDVTRTFALCTTCVPMKVWVRLNISGWWRSDVQARAMYNAIHCEITAPLAVTHPTILGAV